MRSQHRDIMIIERSVTELHELFVEMKAMVDEQGELVNRIDEFVSSAREYIDKADTELGQAVRHQKSRWKVPSLS